MPRGCATTVPDPCSACACPKPWRDWPRHCCSSHARLAARRWIGRDAMPWIYMLVGLGALALALVSKSTVLTALALLAALVLFLMWVLGLLASRVDAGSRDASVIVEPVEL